jgi:fluoride exporter
MPSFIWVALGGAIGSVLRFGVNLFAPRLLGNDFPWATLTVNVVGSFFMGLFASFLAEKFADQPDLRLFLTTGVLGGFTTFSAFSLDVFGLMQRGENSVALVYAIASVILSILAVFGGFIVARALIA